MAPRKRHAATSKKESTQVLPGRLGQKEQQELARGLIDKFGERQSKEAGIDLENGGNDALEQWFLLSVLFSRGISAGQVVNTYKVLSEGGVRNVSDAGKLEYQELWDKLSEGKAQRRDRTTKQLQSVNQVLEDKYGGSVSQLLSSSEDPHEMRANLEALPYVGPTTAELFLRDLRALYPQVKEVLDISDRALVAAQHLGLFSKIGRAGKRQKGTDADAQNAGQPTKAIESLEEIAKGAHVDCRDLETALIKLHNAHHRGYGKCAGGLECSGVEGGGAHGETKKEEVKEGAGAKAEETHAAEPEKKPADFSMEEAADVSKEAARGEEETAPAEASEGAAEAGKEGQPADVSMEAAGGKEGAPADVPEDAEKTMAEAVGDVPAAAEKAMAEEVGDVPEAAEKTMAQEVGDVPEAAEKTIEEEVAALAGSKEVVPDVGVAGKGDQGGGAQEKEVAKQGVEEKEQGGEEAQGGKQEKADVGAKGPQEDAGGEPKQGNGVETKEKPLEVPRLEDEWAKTQQKGAEVQVYHGDATGGGPTGLRAGA